MPLPCEFVGGGCLDGMCWIAGFNHGDVFIALDRQRCCYRWDAQSYCWRFCGFLFAKDDRPPKRKPIQLREHFKDGTLGSMMEFDPDGYRDE